jgi:hypothetical protein
VKEPKKLRRVVIASEIPCPVVIDDINVLRDLVPLAKRHGFGWAQGALAEGAKVHGDLGFAAGQAYAQLRDWQGNAPARAFITQHTTAEARKALGDFSMWRQTRYSNEWRAAASAFLKRMADTSGSVPQQIAGLLDKEQQKAARESLPVWKHHLVRAYVSTARGKGRCVRAAIDLKRGALIEVAPVLLIKNKHMGGPFASDYPFQWSRGVSALPLGFGVIYNHSYDPNAVYYQDHDANVMRYETRRAIKRGEEITINYNGDPTDQSPVWFDVK